VVHELIVVEECREVEHAARDHAWAACRWWNGMERLKGECGKGEQIGCGVKREMYPLTNGPICNYG